MSTPNSILAYQKYGTHRSFISFITNNHFTISPDFLDCFSQYRLIVLESKEFISRMNAGILCENGIKYSIIFKGTSRGKILDLISQYPENRIELLISLRIPQYEYDIDPVALVKLGSYNTLDSTSPSPSPSPSMKV
jgi:hypothetical protein